MENGKGRIKVVVKLYASLRERIGFKEKVLYIEEGQGIVSLLCELEKVIGDRAGLIFDNDRDMKNVMLSLNNVLVSPQKLSRLKLYDEDRVDIMPLPSGG